MTFRGFFGYINSSLYLFQGLSKVKLLGGWSRRGYILCGRVYMSAELGLDGGGGCTPFGGA